MRNKKLLLVLLAATLALCLVFAGCDIFALQHQHNYGKAWRSDETGHWHQCSCGQKTDFAEHKWSEWLVDVEPTATTEGSKHQQCTVCAFRAESVSIPAGSNQPTPHQHNFSTAWRSDETSHWHQCSCGTKQDTAKHTWSDWIIDLDATENTEGSKHQQCTVCEYVSAPTTIPATGGSSQEHQHYFGTSWRSDGTGHWHQCSCGETSGFAGHTWADWVVDVEPTATTEGSRHQECTVCGFATVPSSIPATGGSSTQIRTADFFAINDFHGTVNKMSTVGGYLVQNKNQNKNAVFINSGDMFQGAMESNSNYGQLLANCMDVVGFDSFTFGNHEFDWGLEKLAALAKNGQTPYLGANIYHWNASTRQWGTFASELAEEYTIKTLENGLKVGIIGIIGKDQITSICSQLVQTIGFKDPAEVIPGLYSKLKNQLGCDLVVISAHTGPETFTQQQGTFDISQYADAVFCAHTHVSEVTEINGVPLIQGGSYGSHVSHVTLQVAANGNVSCITKENINYNNSWPNLYTLDNLIDNSNAQIQAEANQVLSYSSNNLSSNGEIPRLVCHAIADYAQQCGYNITLAMTNSARKTIYSGNITYTKLYEAIPFDNTVYVAKVSGRELISRAGYNSHFIWRTSGEAIKNTPTDYYYIAVIDYVLYHQNSERNYNYFASAFTSGFTPVALDKEGYDSGMYNYRYITRDFLLANGNVNVSAYSGENNRTNASLLTEAVTLEDYSQTVTPTTPQHAGTQADPYTVQDALLVAQQNGSTFYYVTGTVCDYSQVQISSSDGSLYRFNLRDADGNKIVVYYLKKFNGATSSNNWATGDLKDGDVLVVYSKLILYNNSTPEVYQGYCISINGVATR